MSKFSALTVAAVALVAGISMASAQDNREGMYMDGDSADNMRVYGPDNMDGSPVIMGSAGKPADCPAGSYYEAAQDQIMACDDDSMFMVTTPAEGSMMPSGEPWPDTARILEYREN